MLVLPADFTAASLPLALTSRSGYHCTLRLLRSEDARALLAFFHSHNAETKRRRYGFAGYEMGADTAQRLASVDQEREIALAMVEKTEGVEQIVAVGRIMRGGEGLLGEMAFVVHEERRRRGLATLLLQALTHFARAKGIQILTAQTQADNYSMLGIFLRHGATISSIPGTDAVEIRMPISPAKMVAARRRRLFFRRQKVA